MTMVLAGARLGTFTEVDISIAVLLVHCSCWQNSRNTFPKSLLTRSHFRIPRKRLTTISLRLFQRKQSYQKNVITQKIKTFANCIDHERGGRMTNGINVKITETLFCKFLELLIKISEDGSGNLGQSEMWNGCKKKKNCLLACSRVPNDAFYRVCRESVN